jgi:hypothetical protein
MSNFVVLDDQRSVVGAWLKAVEALDKRSKQAYNLVYTITEPNILRASDRAAIKVFNSFASSLNVHTTETVANTIFPLDTFHAKGSDLFYDYYLDYIFPKVRKQWGTYFERMVVRRNDDGSAMTKDGIRLNPLERLIEKLDRRVKKTAKTTTHYEIALDDPTFDLATFEYRSGEGRLAVIG